jgi:hypothetical protein
MKKNRVYIKHQAFDTAHEELKTNPEADAASFVACMLATGIHEKQAQIQALSDQVQYLSTLENKIIETCNRKLNEISSSRITYANLFIALTALLVAVLSLVRPH